MAYPDNIDSFVEKLNKKQDDSVHVIEEEVNVSGGIYEDYLKHDNITNDTIKVYTGIQLTGTEITSFIVSIPSDTPWRRKIKIFTNEPLVYITYETTGDTVEADDINALQSSMTATQTELDRYKNDNDLTVSDIDSRLTTSENSKAEKTYVDGQLLLKADKANTYTKTETDQRIQLVVDAAPEALDTLKKIATALNDDPDFAGTVTTQLAGKVDKVVGKDLSSEDYTTIEKNKLAGIDKGANNYTHPSTHPVSMITSFASTVRSTALTGLSLLTNAAVTATDTVLSAIGKLQKQIMDHTSDGENPHGITKAQVGLGNVNNTSDIDKPVSTAMQTALNGKINNSQVLTDVPAEAVFTDTVYTHPSSHPATMITEDSSNRFVSDTEKSNWNDANNKKHEHGNKSILDGISSSDISNWDGKQDALGYIPIDSNDIGVINGIAELDSTGKVPSSQLPSFVDDVLEYADFANLPATGETGKIYVTQETNKTYRWSGSNYIEISQSLALGETSSTAYRGDRGKTAYDHSQIISGNPHDVTKSDIGLSNVDNTSDMAKPISTATQNALDNKANISQLHSHGNKGILDKIIQSGSELNFDLSEFVTSDELGSAGYGDMTKNIYDTDDDGKVDASETADSVPLAGITDKPNIEAHINDVSNPHGVSKAQVGLGSVINYSIASQTEAEVGTSTNRYMTPLRVKQSIAYNAMAKGPVTWNQLKGV